MIRSHRPAPPLDLYIEKLWYCDGYVATGRQERVLPDGRFQLVIDLASLPRPTPIVVGVRSQYAVVAVASMQSVIGVLFRPGGTHGFFDAPADGFRDRLVRLEDVWGPMAGELADRLAAADTPAERFSILEWTLRQRLNRCRTLHPAVRFLLDESRHNATSVKVGSLSKRVGLSRRWLSVLFREQVGLTPKLYCRLRRFQGVAHHIRASPPIDWAGLSAAHGYADQAHLTHEFRRFSGVTPGAFATLERRSDNHIAID